SELNYERSFSKKLQDGVFAVLDYLEEHLPENLKPIIEKVMQLLPVRQEQSMDEPEHEHTWGGMEL
ncbi:MAG: plasmid recombination protein, partial [Brevinema sp.]